MDEILKAVKEGKCKEIKVLCYAQDDILTSENEDQLQKLVHKLNIDAKKFWHYIIYLFGVGTTLYTYLV